MTPDRWRTFFETLHHMLILFDDWLCKEYGFSRQARGKYLLDKTA